MIIKKPKNTHEKKKTQKKQISEILRKPTRKKNKKQKMQKS